MTAAALTKPLGSVPVDERPALVRPFVGRICRIAYGQFNEREIVGRVVGASYHLTNGNSTGDLIVSEPDGVGGWRVGGTSGYSTVSIALCRIRSIEEIA